MSYMVRDDVEIVEENLWNHILIGSALETILAAGVIDESVLVELVRQRAERIVEDKEEWL